MNESVALFLPEYSEFKEQTVREQYLVVLEHGR